MEISCLVKKMEGLGFKDYGWGNLLPVGQCRVFGKRCLEGPECGCNGKVPELIVHVYFHTDPELNMKVEFVVHGEARGRWIKLMVYSLDVELIGAVLPEVSRAMGAMWMAGHKALL